MNLTFEIDSFQLNVPQMSEKEIETFKKKWEESFFVGKNSSEFTIYLSEDWYKPEDILAPYYKWWEKILIKLKLRNVYRFITTNRT